MSKNKFGVVKGRSGRISWGWEEVFIFFEFVYRVIRIIIVGGFIWGGVGSLGSFYLIG